jgi:hypothetical protein
MSDALFATATTTNVSGVVSANVGGVITVMMCARDLTVAVGDVLVVQRIGSQWVAQCRVFAAAPVDNANSGTAPPSTGTTGALTVSPVTTQTYRASLGGWRTDTPSVVQGDYSGTGNNTGCVFFGGAPRSLAGATVTSAVAKVRRVSGGAYSAVGTTMRLVTQSTRPGGAPTLTSSTSGPSIAVGTTTTFSIPNSWAQAMVDGSAGGVAFLSTGDAAHYVKFAGLAEWSAAFTMTIGWSR